MHCSSPRTRLWLRIPYHENIILNIVFIMDPNVFRKGISFPNPTMHKSSANRRSRRKTDEARKNRCPTSPWRAGLGWRSGRVGGTGTLVCCANKPRQRRIEQVVGGRRLRPITHIRSPYRRAESHSRHRVHSHRKLSKHDNEAVIGRLGGFPALVAGRRTRRRPPGPLPRRAAWWYR